MKKLILSILPFLLNMCSTNKYDISAYSILVKEEINMSVGEIIEYAVYSKGFLMIILPLLTIIQLLD